MPRDNEKRLLRERKRRLAAMPSVEESGAGFLSLVEFRLAHERYAVEERYVDRVAFARHVTPLPMVPPYVVGIVFDNGRIHSVVDVKAWLGLPLRGLSERDPLLFVGNGEMELAIIADEILGMERISMDLIRPMDGNSGGSEPYLLGMTQGGVIVIDLGTVLSSDGIVVR
jgi:purine-binding chemotaxis protein CheW